MDGCDNDNVFVNGYDSIVYFSGLAASPSFFFKALETLKLTVVAPDHGHDRDLRCE